MDIPKISLIIPIYNSEKIIKKHMQTVFNQTFKDFEIIFIDDGSNDSSYKIMEEFKNKYSNIILLHQENKGPGPARNFGIKEAQGEYIAFMDNDDFLEPNYLEKLYNAAIKYDADIVHCEYKMYFPDYKFKISSALFAKNKVYETKEAIGKLISDVTMHSFPWNKLYRKKLFIEHGLKFENMYFEDVVLAPRLYYYANKVVTLSDSLYIYTQHRASILGSMNDVKINDLLRSIGYTRTFLEEHNCYEEYKFALKNFGLKIRWVNYFSIFRLHFLTWSFKGFYKNIKNSNYCVKYFIGSDFNKKNDIILPYEIHLD